MDTWRALCAVYVDCSTVNARIFELALSSIWTKIRELGVSLIGCAIRLLPIYVQGTESSVH